MLPNSVLLTFMVSPTLRECAQARAAGRQVLCRDSLGVLHETALLAPGSERSPQNSHPPAPCAALPVELAYGVARSARVHLFFGGRGRPWAFCRQPPATRRSEDTKPGLRRLLPPNQSQTGRRGSSPHTRVECNVRGAPPHVASWCYGPNERIMAFIRSKRCRPRMVPAGRSRPIPW